MDKIKAILEEVFSLTIDWCASCENDLVGCATISCNLCVNIWASEDKAEVRFINPTPYKEDITKVMRDYIPCLFSYSNVEQVKKITNRLVIKFKDL